MISIVSLSNKKKELLLGTIFLTINVIFYIFSADNATFIEGADAGQYYGPAISLFQDGGLRAGPGVEFSTLGTPLYSILLAIPIGIFGIDHSSLVIVFIQCFLLYLTGIITRKFSIVFLKKESFLLHSLIIFNPNSLITAHLVQTETLFTLFLVLSVYYLFKLIEKNSFKYVFLLSVFLGLLTLTRPAGLYLIYFVPVLLLGFVYINNRTKIKNYAIKVFLLVLLSLSMISPWVIRNYLVFDEVFVSSNAGPYLKDQYIQLLKIGRQWDEKEAIDYINILQKNYIENNIVKDICIQNERHWSCNDYMFNSMMSGIIKEPISSHTKAFLSSWGYLYLSGGASNIRNYFGILGKEHIISFQKRRSDGISGVVSFIKTINMSYLVILIATTGFSFATRFLGLIGLFSLVKSSNTIRSYAAIIIMLLLLFTAMYMYLGQSRFRVPLEPFLMIFSTIAIFNFCDRFNHKK